MGEAEEDAMQDSRSTSVDDVVVMLIPVWWAEGLSDRITIIRVTNGRRRREEVEQKRLLLNVILTECFGQLGR